MTTTQPVTTLEPVLAQEQIRILTVGTAGEAFQFARDVPGADIGALQERVLETGHAWHVILFAKHVRGADVSACQAMILKIGRHLSMFASKVPGADIAAMQARELEIGSERRLYEFARDVSGADVEALYARALTLGFNGPGRAEFDALLAAYRAQRQQQAAGHRAQATQAELEIADDAGAAPDTPAA